eukprot:scaffold1378_cov257-Pinguiococcus_pyrenoidosus.AAC.11
MSARSVRGPDFLTIPDVFRVCVFQRFRTAAEEHFSDFPLRCLHCYECGQIFHVGQVQKLRRHLRRKTAWTNAGLVGCRVNCLVNNKVHFLPGKPAGRQANPRSGWRMLNSLSTIPRRTTGSAEKC